MKNLRKYQILIQDKQNNVKDVDNVDKEAKIMYNYVW